MANDAIVEAGMRRLILKMSVDRFVGGPNGEIDWIFPTLGGAKPDWAGFTTKTQRHQGRPSLGHKEIPAVALRAMSGRQKSPPVSTGTVDAPIGATKTPVVASASPCALLRPRKHSGRSRIVLDSPQRHKGTKAGRQASAPFVPYVAKEAFAVVL